MEVDTNPPLGFSTEAKRLLSLTHHKLVKLIENKITEIDFEEAKKDVIDFLKDRLAIAMWSPEFFVELTRQLKSTSSKNNK